MGKKKVEINFFWGNNFKVGGGGMGDVFSIGNLPYCFFSITSFMRALISYTIFFNIFRIHKTYILHNLE